MMVRIVEMDVMMVGMVVRIIVNTLRNMDIDGSETCSSYKGLSINNVRILTFARKVGRGSVKF